MRSIPLTLLALSVTALVGCKAIDAMDNTQTMKTDLAAMKTTTAGMATTTGAMRGSTDELKRLAQVGAGLDLIGKPENTKEFNPPQANMLAGAKLLAENMTSDEMIKFFYTKLKELNKTTADDSKFDRRLLGGYSTEYVAQFNRGKQVQAVILESVAAQIPQPMLEQLILEQIEGGGGRFSDTAYTLLMLRAMFINSYYLDAGVFSTTWDTIGKVRDAYTYTTQLQFIASLPYADKIQFTVEGPAFLPPVNAPALQQGDADYGPKCVTATPPDASCFATLGDAPNLNTTLDPGIAKTWWKRIVKNIDRQLPDSLKNSNSPFAREVAEIRDNATRNSIDAK